MYINQFVAGVFATLGVEALAFIGAVIAAAITKKRGKK